jgi:chromosome segregation ATPase
VTVDYTEKLTRLKDGLEKAKDLRVKALTKLEGLEAQEQELVKELRSKYEVDPEKLEDEIARLEKQIAEMIAEIEAIIPWDLLSKFKQ